MKVEKRENAVKKRTNQGKSDRSLSPTDYRLSSVSGRTFMRLVMEGILLTAGIDYLFFQRWFMLIPLTVLVPFWISFRKKQLREKRQKKLYYSFKDALNSLSVALQAGYSVENAFFETEKNLRRLQGESDLVREFAYINAGIRLNRQPEGLFEDFAQRSGVEDILNFSTIFSSQRRAGGSLSETVRRTAAVIEGKIEVEREIDSTSAAKRLEYRIMILMPPLIILYMQLTSPGYLDILYKSALGFVVMLVSFAGYAAAVYAGGRIIDIRV